MITTTCAAPAPSSSSSLAAPDIPWASTTSRPASQQRFTVVTYDHLGLAHGRLGKPVEEQRVEWWSEGAARVLDAVLPAGSPRTCSAPAPAPSPHSTSRPGTRPAAARGRARATGRGVLPDAERQRAMFTDVYDTYRKHGLEAAAARMNAGLEERPSAPVEPGHGSPTALPHRRVDQSDGPDPSPGPRAVHLVRPRSRRPLLRPSPSHPRRGNRLRRPASVPHRHDPRPTHRERRSASSPAGISGALTHVGGVRRTLTETLVPVG